MKNKIRLFPLHCCKKVIRLDEHIFTADGKLDFHCEKHGEQAVINALTWRGGITEEALEAAKKKEEEENESKSNARKNS